MLGFPQGSLGGGMGRGISGLLVVRWGSVGGLRGSIRGQSGVRRGSTRGRQGSNGGRQECSLGIHPRYVWGNDRWVSQ